jgi:two-component system chemotaxis response regulator CheY
MRILLVDDSRTMRRIERRVLAEAWPQAMICECRNGREALALMEAHHVEREPFDLLLVAWTMADLDGRTFLQRLREGGQTVPAIVVATAADQADMVEAIKAGASHYLYKPFTPEALVQKVQQTLQRYGMERTRVAA